MTWIGVFPAVTTKFDEDGALDVAEMERCCAMQIEAGVDGLIAGGSLGEGSMLEPKEKITALRVCRNVSSGRVPVLGTISEPSTAAGQAWYFLVRGANACGWGIWGTASDGSDRATTVCD